MSMTELIGRLESQGWRFRLNGDRITTRLPKPRPVDAVDLLLELGRRSAEAVGFLREREGAFGAPETFNLGPLRGNS